MTRRLLAALAAVVFALAPGCVKEISSDDRLERDTRGEPVKKAASAAELVKLNCQDTAQGLSKARAENRPENDRVLVYIELHQKLKDRLATFEEAMSRNPDLAYQEGSQELVAARESCVQNSADVRMEFERYVRELIDVPTVQEVRGGSSVVMPRIDFATFRLAIESLAPDDREQLLGRIATAERKVEVVPAEPRKKGK